MTEDFLSGFPTLHARVRGCLLGGAVGDALGAPVEFMSLAEIRRKFGAGGLRDYAPAYGRRGAITDDTQMTLFTAEGLLRAWVRGEIRGICGVQGVIHYAYLRWLLTQGERPTQMDEEIGTDGWLFGVRALHSRRAPGLTCLSALRAADGRAKPDVARNASKGCGGVMRAAPVGLFPPVAEADREIFDLAADVAALTHGHPSGYLAAGHLAMTIAALARGEPLAAAVDAADRQLSGRDGHEEVTAAIGAARALAAGGAPSQESLEALGGGWVAEEALAIALCCALTADDFSDGVTRAANHTGDSDSTAAITGNLLGTLWGDAAIPVPWLADLELCDEIGQIADDLHAVIAGTLSAEAASDRYPGW